MSVSRRWILSVDDYRHVIWHACLVEVGINLADFANVDIMM